MDRKICLTHKNMPPKVCMDIPYPLAYMKHIFRYLSLSEELCSRMLKGMQNINKLKLNQVNMYSLDGSLFTLWMLWKVFQTVEWAFNIQQLHWECRRHAIKFKGKRRIQQAYLLLSFMDPDAITTYQTQSASWKPSSFCDLMRKENSTWKFQPFPCSHLH